MSVIDDEAAASRDGFLELPLRVRSAMLAGLFLLAIFYTGYFAAPIIVPIVGALLLNFLFSPIVAAASRRHIPRLVAAAGVVGMLVAIMGAGLYWLADPAAEWLRAAPGVVDELRGKLVSGPNALAEVREASEAVEEAVQELAGGGDDDAPDVEIKAPGLLDVVMNRLPVVLGGLVVAMFLTFLLLATSDKFLRKLTSLGATFAARRRIVRIIRQMEAQVAHYLGTVAIINILLGCTVAGAMYLVGLPNAPLWGATAALLNFAPYIGPALTAAVLFLVGVNEFGTLGAALIPAGVFLAITTVEGQVLTPFLLGHRLDLSPVVVFVSVMVLGWMWGMIGALMAVPIMATVKICLVNLPRTRPLGRLMGR
jgi:predicted PurR-regulated permease PerM